MKKLVGVVVHMSKHSGVVVPMDSMVRLEHSMVELGELLAIRVFRL